MENLFCIKDKVAIITGGYGVLGSNIARHLAKEGAQVILIGRSLERGEALVNELNNEGGRVSFLQADVLNIKELQNCKKHILERYKRLDILINVAGGNVPGATLSEEQAFFDMKVEDWQKVIDLNLDGTVFPCLVFGEIMGQQKSGSIINISSMAAMSAITRVPGYSAAKSGVSIFTQWLATDMALKYGDKVRVNAIAPGFFIGDQNRDVLINADGTLTERSHKVIAKTPMKRFGDISELNGAVQFLCSDAASFVTGVVLPVDGGFSSFSGV